MISEIMDSGDRRLGFDRRHFSYAGYIPERRSIPDRRSGVERRVVQEEYKGTERRAVFYKNTSP
jgi:hypothetical protein